jgi:hypothetical protein
MADNAPRRAVETQVSVLPDLRLFLAPVRNFRSKIPFDTAIPHDICIYCRQTLSAPKIARIAAAVTVPNAYNASIAPYTYHDRLHYDCFYYRTRKPALPSDDLQVDLEPFMSTDDATAHQTNHAAEIEALKKRRIRTERDQYIASQAALDREHREVLKEFGQWNDTRNAFSMFNMLPWA